MEKLEVANKELETARSLVATNYEKAKKFDDLNCELETIKTANLDLTSKEKMLTEKLEETTAIHKGTHLEVTYIATTILKWGVSSRWLSALWFPVRNSDQMTTEKTHATLTFF